MEVKTLKGKLNQKQQKFHELWNGNIHIVHSPEEALRVVIGG
jgi:hypothetical protein